MPNPSPHSTAATRWSKPQEVADAEIAFPANVSKLLPSRDEIPEEFWRGNTKWNKIVGQWFFCGLKGSLEPKKGIDKDAAMRHLRVVLGSWEPKHEHKESGVAYLMSLWFTRFIPRAEASDA